LVRSGWDLLFKSRKQKVTISEIKDPVFEQFNFKSIQFKWNGRKLAELELYPYTFTIYWETSSDPSDFAKHVKQFVMSLSEIDRAIYASLSCSFGIPKKIEDIEAIEFENLLSLIQSLKQPIFIKVYTAYGDIWCEFKPPNLRKVPLCGIVSEYAIGRQVIDFFCASNVHAAKMKELEINQLFSRLGPLLENYRPILPTWRT